MSKLTRRQWFDLNMQFSRTPGLDDSFMPSGEHYILTSLLNSFNIHPKSRQEALRIAEELLCEGWLEE
jgi:hypothetical protein